MLIGVIAEELLDPLAVTAHTTFVDFDQFAWPSSPSDPTGAFYGVGPRIYEIGFVSPGTVVDETVSGAERFPTIYVTEGYQGIWPDLFDDTVPEVFYNFTQSFDPVLVTPLFVEFNFIPTSNIQVIAIHPNAVFVDADIIFSPAFRSSLTPNLVTGDDIIRAQVIRRDGDAIVLLTEVFSDLDAIFASVLAQALLPGIVNEHFPTGDVIYTASQGGRLEPVLFSSDDTFFAPFVFNQLNPSRVLDTDTLFGPALRTPGHMGLFVDDDIFFVPSVQFAALAPPLVAEADIIAQLLSGSVPPIGPLDPIVDFDDTFYVPNVIISQSLAPHLWPDVDSILSVPSVALGQPLFPGLFNEGDIFFAPTSTLVPVLFPALFADTEIFFAPTAIFDQFLVQQFTAVDTDVFLAPTTAALASFDGTLTLDGPIMPSSHQPTVIIVEG